MVTEDRDTRYVRWIWSATFGLLFLALSSCANGPSEPERYAPAEALEGSWQWVRSVNVNTGQIHDPAAEDFEAELTFTASSELEGTFSYRRTNASEVIGTFGIGFEDVPGNDFIALERSIDFLESHAWLSAGTDSLRLGGVMEGGYNSTYVRVPK